VYGVTHSCSKLAATLTLYKLNCVLCCVLCLQVREHAATLPQPAAPATGAAATAAGSSSTDAAAADSAVTDSSSSTATAAAAVPVAVPVALSDWDIQMLNEEVCVYSLYKTICSVEC
jgi:hypothetical protein